MGLTWSQYRDTAGDINLTRFAIWVIIRACHNGDSVEPKMAILVLFPLWPGCGMVLECSHMVWAGLRHGYGIFVIWLWNGAGIFVTWLWHGCGMVMAYL